MQLFFLKLKLIVTIIGVVLIYFLFKFFFPNPILNKHLLVKTNLIQFADTELQC